MKLNEAKYYGSRTFLLTFIFAVVFAACSKPPPTLRLGTNVWPGYEPLYLAKELGYLSKDKVRLVEYSSASQVLQAYRNTQLDAAALTLDEAVQLSATEDSVRIIMVLDISNGGDVILAKPAIKSLSELKGHRVGVEGSALGAYIITRALDQVELTKSDIKIISADVKELTKAYLNDEVDAVVTFEPERSRLLASGAKEIFNSKHIFGEIVDVLVVRDSFIRQYPATIKHLRQSWFQALDHLQKEPEKSAEIIRKRLKLSVKQTLESYQGLILPDMKYENQLIFSQPKPQLLTTAAALSGLMLENGLLREKVAVKKLFLTPDLIEKIKYHHVIQSEKLNVSVAQDKTHHSYIVGLSISGGYVNLAGLALNQAEFIAACGT